MTKNELLLNIAIDCIQNSEKCNLLFHEIPYESNHNYIDAIMEHYGVLFPDDDNTDPDDPPGYASQQEDRIQEEWDKALVKLRQEAIEYLTDLKEKEL